MTEYRLRLKEVGVKLGGRILLNQISFCVAPGECWAICGSSGSGKTILGETIAGRHFFSGEIEFGKLPGGRQFSVGFVEQQHRFRNLSNTTDLYYQQRFNASDAESTITVDREISDALPLEKKKDKDLLDLLHVTPLLNKPLIQLSNGENKRVQLAIALHQEPDLLILDNPFIGLDVDGRKLLHEILNILFNQKNILLLLITSQRELPACVTHGLILENGNLLCALPKAELPVEERMQEKRLTVPELFSGIPRGNHEAFQVAVEMKNVNITYGETQVLKNIHWKVMRGECWNLSGPNGAGKSTLLSLITGDNPQAYANEIYLFDRKRGSGESIWDIKRKTGYVSPELHLYFDSSATCYEVVASGFFDTIGLFRHLTYEQDELVKRWMDVVGLLTDSQRRLRELPAGKQRLVLLARALIKNPPLLILDEPCQGFDDTMTNDFRTLIDQLVITYQRTLIYVSHYANELPSCVNKFLKLDHGKII